MSVVAEREMSSTARSNASAFAFDGCVKPLSLRTNCRAASRTSASVAGGSKLKSVRMLRHMASECRSGRLGAVVALDDHGVGGGDGLADLARSLVLVRVP